MPTVVTLPQIALKTRVDGEAGLTQRIWSDLFSLLELRMEPGTLTHPSGE